MNPGISGFRRLLRVAICAAVCPFATAQAQAQANAPTPSPASNALTIASPAPVPTQPAPPVPRKPHPDFEVQVSGQGRAVIFIPGLATPGEIWQPVVDQLQGCQAHVISLAGFGTVKPTGANPFLHKVRDEIIAYIRSEKLDHPVIVGHSLGGFLTLWIATAAPDLPSRLVIVDALPFLPAIMNPSATPQSMRAQIAPMIDLMSNSGQEAFMKTETAAIYSMVTLPEDARKVAAMTDPSDPQTSARAMMELMTTDLRPDLKKITCPVVVFAALADKVVYAPREMVLANYRKQYDGLAGIRVEGFDKAKHFIMIDDLPDFVKALEAELGPGAAK